MDILTLEKAQRTVGSVPSVRAQVVNRPLTRRISLVVGIRHNFQKNITLPMLFWVKSILNFIKWTKNARKLQFLKLNRFQIPFYFTEFEIKYLEIQSTTYFGPATLSEQVP